MVRQNRGRPSGLSLFCFYRSSKRSSSTWDQVNLSVREIDIDCMLTQSIVE